MKLLIAIVVFLSAIQMHAQDKYFTRNGSISFISKAPLEDIEANHKAVTCVLDTKTGNIQFSVLMKGFEFKKALMQEHFNENYVESHKYPKAEFRGAVVNHDGVNYTGDGTYEVTVKGKMTIHGVTKDTEAKGKIVVKSSKPEAFSTFTILLSDYQIEIPKLVKDNISNTVKIEVNCSLEPLKG